MGLSPATRNRKYASLKAFLKWLFEEGAIQKDLQSLVKLPRVPERVPHYLSVDEALHLIKTIQKKAKKAELTCDLPLILLLYGGGLRVSEACNMLWEQVDFEGQVLRVKGKGGRERIVAIPKKVLQNLKNTLKSQIPPPHGGGGLGGGEHKPTRIFPELSTRKAYDIVRSWGRRAALTKPLSPHILRHSFATHLLNSGADLRALQELLGHRSLTATQKYTHLQISHLSRVLETRHPLKPNKKGRPPS